MADPLLFVSDPDSCIMTQKPFFFCFYNSIFSYSHLKRSLLTPELLISLTAIKSLGSLAGGLQNATRLHHTEGPLSASRHHTHPFMAEGKSEKGAQPSPWPKGFPRKLGLSAEAPGTPPSPGRRRRQLHASPRRRCPSPVLPLSRSFARRAPSSWGKLSGSAIDKRPGRPSASLPSVKVSGWGEIEGDEVIRRKGPGPQIEMATRRRRPPRARGDRGGGCAAGNPCRDPETRSAA